MKTLFIIKTEAEEVDPIVQMHINDFDELNQTLLGISVAISHFSKNLGISPKELMEIIAKTVEEGISYMKVQ